MNTSEWSPTKISPIDPQKSRQVRIGLLFLLLIGLFFLSVQFQGASVDKMMPLWLSWASLMGGILVGFLYSISVDKKKFSPLVTAVNGVIGGALLTDLAKGGNSLVIKAFRSVAEVAHFQPHGEVLVAAMAISFVAIGFLGSYFIMKVDVNPMLAGGDRETAAAAEFRRELDKGRPGEKQKVPRQVQNMAKQVLKTNENVREPASLLERGLALMAEEKSEEAISVLEKIPTESALYADSQTYLAYAYLNLELYQKAATILDRSVSRPGSAPSMLTWKLIGYVYLFLEARNEGLEAKRRRLKRSIDASRAALNFDDKDTGVLLNLACAYGQMGPEDPEARKQLFETLSQLFHELPSSVDWVIELTGEGEDFCAWKEDAQFKKALESPTTPQLWLPPPAGSWK